MAQFLAHIAELVINQPLMILPEKLAVIASVLEGRIKIDAADLKDLLPKSQDETPKPMGSRYVGEFRPQDPNDPRSPRKSYRQTDQGVAIIPVHGSLVNRGGFLDAMSGITSYEKLKYQLGAASADREIASILLDIDSGGGEAVGAFETGDAVRLAANIKPVVAIGNGLMCSAAYAIACGAGHIIASRSSVVGSIGTALLHLDRSKQLADAGIKPTLFITGKRKGDGSPFFELSDEVKGELRSYIQRVNQNFLDLVASNRKGTSAEKLLALEAGVFIGAEAIAHGLIDDVGSFEMALSELHRAPRLKPLRAGSKMDKIITQAELDAAVATARSEGVKEGTAAGTAAGTTAGIAQGIAAERERFKGVMTSANYAGREASANHVLFSTNMSVEEIGGVLAGITAPVAPKSDAEKLAEANRTKDAQGGLVVDGAQADANGGKTAPANDFDKGKSIVASLGLKK